MFGEVRIHLFFGVPKICFNPAFVDPLLKSLRHDPRYAALLKKLNLPT
jgi:hypothetical protein